ncbi:TonB-dependent receptor [Desulfobacula toluolica]|nr:TonB-dependent receptor [Desulfobacula toluolica]
MKKEIRIQSLENSGRLKWMVGLYYSFEEQDYHDFSITYDTMAFGHNTKYNWPGNRSTKTMAAFGQVTVPIAGSLDFTAGLRCERVNKELDYRHYDTRTDTGERLSSVEWSREEDWDALLPKAVLSWRMNKDAMTYFSVSQGDLAGGLNANGDDKETAKFDEQTSLNYEIGAKTAFLDNRLFFNAAKAHSQGIELELKARPLQGLDISTAFGWTDAEFDEYKNYTGKTPKQMPAYTFNLGIQYRVPCGFFVRGEMEGLGRTYYDEANTIKQDAFQLYHAKIGYEASNWDVYLYCNNLLDKEYFSSMSFGRFSVAEPRTFGVFASVRF